MWKKIRYRAEEAIKAAEKIEMTDDELYLICRPLLEIIDCARRME